MYAVIVSVKIDDRESAEAGLLNEVVPRTAKAPGLVAAYWTFAPGEGTSGHGEAMMVFESEEQAHAAAGQSEPPRDAPVTIESISVREVVAHL